MKPIIAIDLGGTVIKAAIVSDSTILAMDSILRPHREPDSAASTRFATGFSHKLLVLPAANKSAVAPPLLQVEPAGVVVISLKPSDDGKALIVRLFGASGKAEQTNLNWSFTPKQVTLSSTAEEAGQPVGKTVDVPAWSVVTLRAELP